MQTRRGKIILGLVILGLFFCLQKIYSYNNILTHPKLTGAVVNFYNENAVEKLTKEQANWIIQGSIDEDDPVLRCVNHFFDPISNKGLSDGKYKYAPGIPAPDWANSSIDQSIGIYGGDFSWQTAIYNYQQKDFQKAFISLGHVLHLLEDMAVPAHTRNDAHEEGDPYEKWVKENNYKIKVNIANSKLQDCDSNRQCLKELAQYTNNNFFSKDSIDSKIFVSPIIPELPQENGYVILNNIQVAYYNFKENKLTIERDIVHQSYWDNLSPKIVGYGAGLIELFFKEAEENKIKKPQTAFINFLEEMGKTVIGAKNKIISGWQLINESYEKVANNYPKQEQQQGKEQGKVLSAEEKNKDLPSSLTIEQKEINTEVKTGNTIVSTVEDRAQIKENIGVARVIDGDTIVLTTGETVRYIGIDSPELGKQGAEDDECLAWVARLRNMELLAKGDFKIVKDESADKDKYGRLLRYVYANGIFINKQLASDGLAEPFFCEYGWENCPVTSDNNRKQEILSASILAKQNKIGLFSDICSKKIVEKNVISEKKNEIQDNNNLDSGNNINIRPVINKKSNFVFINGGEDSVFPITTIINKPTNPTNLSTAEFVFTANEQAIFQCLLDNENWQDCASPVNYIKLSAGSHQFNVKAIDLAGNVELNPVEYIWEIDLTIPSTPNVLWPDEFPYYASSTPIVVSGSNDNGLIVLLHSSVKTETVEIIDSTNWQSSLGLIEGENIFYIKSADQFSAESGEDDFTIILDTIAPAVAINSGPGSFASSTIAEFEFSADEENINYQCQLDNSGWQTCSASTTINNLAEDGHVLEVKAIDQANNVSGAASHNWLADITAPTSTMESLLNEYEQIGFTVSWSGSDASSTVQTSGLANFDAQYKISEAGEWQNWVNAATSTSTVFSINVSAGSDIYFRVSARDNAGNISEWSDIAQTRIADNTADYLVISEISLGAGDAEWVELYNPTEEIIDLANEPVYLYYFSSARNWNDPYKPAADKRKLTGNIPAKGFYLVKIDGEGTLPSFDYNWNYSGSANTLNDLSGSIAIFPWDIDAKTPEEAEQGKIDAVGWGSANYVKEGESVVSASMGESIERKSAATSTAETMAAGGIHEKSGNGYDSDNNSNDFVVRNSSGPQTLSSSKEPRPEISNGLVHLWHFDECKNATSSDSISSADLANNDNKWEVGKWDCSIRQYSDYENMTTSFADSLNVNNFTISFYYKFPHNNSRPYFRFFNDSSDQLKMLFYPYYTEVWGLPHEGMWRYEDIEWPYGDDWHQITLTVNSNIGYWILYLDGNEFYREAMDYNMFISNSFEINGDNNYNLIDEIAVWDRALGSEEIKDIFDADLPLSPYKERDPQQSAQKIHYWNFNEGFGSTAYDIIGNDNLTVNDSSWVINGYASSSIWQTYHSQYSIEANLGTAIDSQDLSIDFWWRNESFPYEGRGSLMLNNNNNETMFGITATHINAYYYYNGNKFLIYSIPNDDQWHHIALVYDSYLYKLYFYVDGAEKATNSVIWFQQPITKLQIYGENNRQEIDEINIWEGALTAEQVLEIYNQ